jgi:hypothetical protein
VIVGVRNIAQGLAACLMGCKCGQVIVGWPTRHLRPSNRFELAVREFQRFFG